MALRTAHGNAARGGATVVVEVPPSDELRPIEPAKLPVRRPPPRNEATRFASGSRSTAEAAAKGGRARQEKARRARAALALGLGDLATRPEFERYLTDADRWRDEHSRDLARIAGRGKESRLSTGPSSMIATAALQLAGSRYLFVVGGRESDLAKAALLLGRASALGDASRQNVLAAYHLAEVEAKSERALERRRALVGEGGAGAGGADDVDEKALEKRRHDEAAKNAGALTVRGEVT